MRVFISAKPVNKLTLVTANNVMIRLTQKVIVYKCTIAIK